MAHGTGGPPGERGVVRIRDLAGRPRGLGFLVDTHGTLLTSHEAVDGLARLVLHAPGAEYTCLVGADAIAPLPGAGLAVVRTTGLDAPPYVLAARSPAPGTAVRVAFPREPVDGRVTGATTATYTATDGFHLVADALELSLPAGHEELGRCGRPAGAPVLDAASGAVVGVLGTALHGSRGGVHCAVPLRLTAATGDVDPYGWLEAVLRSNGATVPAYGRDLNLAGVLRLASATHGCLDDGVVERPRIEGAFAAFLDADEPVLGLVGEPGTGRSTALAALARGRARAGAPAVLLRGASLRIADAGVRDAVRRALDSAPADDAAALARSAGEPLLVLLDAPEEMPPVLAHDLAAWTEDTAQWLTSQGVRLVVACRPEFWEVAGALLPGHLLHRADGPAETLPPCLRLDDFTREEAAAARSSLGLPADPQAGTDGGHPLALRLLAGVSGAMTAPPEGTPRRDELFAAHLDLACLRAAERIGTARAEEPAASDPAPSDPAPSDPASSDPTPSDPAGTLRRATRLSGTVHEAARRCLGPGQGELDRSAFEELFPWRSGRAQAVLDVGLFVAAGAGYRFADEEFGEWLQGAHIDVDAALRALVHRGAQPDALPATGGPAGRGRGLPLPRHRIGPVLEALLHLERWHGATALAGRLEDLAVAVDTFAHREIRLSGGAGEGPTAGAWWAARLLRGTLLRVPDATPYLPVLRLLCERLQAHCAAVGGFARAGATLGAFGPRFWTRLPLPYAERLTLLRRLVPADHGRPSRFLTAAGELLGADPVTVQPLLCAWFGDERPLPDAGPAEVTVADAAQALLHTHRRDAVDDLADALVASAHPRAAELLVSLCEDEPAAICRAVDRWAHDPSPDRHRAAARYAPLAAARTGADRELLRHAAQALLALPAGTALYGPALTLLVRDPHTRPRYLPHALALFRAGDPRLAPDAFGPALATHPEPVLAALRTRLAEPGPVAAAVLALLAEQRGPEQARRAAGMVREYAARRPERAADVAAFVERRLEDGPAARAVLQPLVVELLTDHPAAVRRALAPVLAAPGSRASRPLRRELLAVLLAGEQDAGVLDAVLTAAARDASRRAPWRTRDLVHHTGLRLTATPEGASAFDHRLLELVRLHPEFGALLRDWLTRAPQDWAAVVGPSTQQVLGVTPVG